MTWYNLASGWTPNQYTRGFRMPDILVPLPLVSTLRSLSQPAGCEEFYNPKDGWKEGWRDVARSLKLARILG